MNTDTSVPNDKNPVISYAVLVASALLGLIPYLSLAGAYKTFNAEKWHAATASLSIMTAIVLFVFAVCFYVVREYGVDSKGCILRLVDIEELEGKGYIDYILAHYGNVASVATFCAALVYLAKGSLPYVGITVTSLVMAITVTSIFLLYGVVFAKSVWGARARSAWVIASLIPMLFLDVVFMQMAIQAAASL